jgi:transcriptional regulator with XRE-family HTH domain
MSTVTADGQARAPGPDPGAPHGSLADALNFLFETIRPERDEVSRGKPGREFYNSEIADRINGPGPIADRIREAVGEPVKISGAYIGELRQGKATDPRLSHLKALAFAFGVPTSYLVNDGEGPSAEAIERDLRRLDHLRRLGVQQVMLRDVLGSSGLSDRSQEALTSIFQHLLEVEGVSDTDDTS